MKSYELLDLIGEVNEDYVRAADETVIRPRFRWKALAACAACAALVAAYPLYRALRPPLHDYAVMDYGAILPDLAGGASAGDAVGESIAEGPGADGGAMDQAPPQAAPPAGEDAPGGSDRSGFKVSGGVDAGGAPVNGNAASGSQKGAAGAGSADAAIFGAEAPEQEAALWYDALFQTMRLEENPPWYGGAWIAGERLLAVAVVEDLRTPELEAEIQAAAGEGAALRLLSVKFSLASLEELMEPVSRALEGTGLCYGMGVDVMDNCLGVDVYGDGAIPDGVLAELARLDPGGDAIRVRVFSGALSGLGDAAASDG